MPPKFSSTPRSALIKVIFSVVVTLSVLAILAFSVTAMVPFFLHERYIGIGVIVFGLIWLTLLFGAFIFVMSTWDNWRDYQRVKLLHDYMSAEELLSSYLVVYKTQTKAPDGFQFSRFYHWLDGQKTLLDSGNVLDGLHALEKSGAIIIERPETGGLLITLPPEFLTANQAQD